MRHWRWAVVLTGVLVLCSIPVVRAQWPVDEPDVATDELIARIAGSDDVPFQGLFESRGGLRLPDLGRLQDEVRPFRETSRVRVWYAAPDDWRADELLVGAERGTYREPGVLWLWDSGRREVDRSVREGPEPLRIPRLMDLSPPELGRRLLAESAGEAVSRIAARRVAGRTGAGLRIVPSSPAATIDHVDLWADPATGLVLAVEVDTGGTAPVFETAFVDLALTAPAAGVVRFDPTQADAPIRAVTSVDPVEAVASFAFVPLPDTLAGLQRRNDPDAGVATYGEGLTVVTLIVAPQGALGRRITRLPRTERSWGGEAALIETSLINILVSRIGALEVVLAGTVSVAELDRIAAAALGAGTIGPGAGG